MAFSRSFGSFFSCIGNLLEIHMRGNMKDVLLLEQTVCPHCHELIDITTSSAYAALSARCERYEKALEYIADRDWTNKAGRPDKWINEFVDVARETLGRGEGDVLP